MAHNPTAPAVAKKKAKFPMAMHQAVKAWHEKHGMKFAFNAHKNKRKG